MVEDVAVTVVGSELEAELACRLLRTEEIACYHRPTPYAAGAGDGLVATWSPREIVVLGADAQRARELLLDG